MKVNVQVFNGIVRVSERSHSFESGEYEVLPFKITRSPAGDFKKSAMRYHYQAHFKGYGDMIDIHGLSIDGRDACENIMRNKNPRFNPKNLNWTGNVAHIGTNQC